MTQPHGTPGDTSAALGWILGTIVMAMPCTGVCAPAGEGSGVHAQARVTGPLPATQSSQLSLDDIVVLSRKTSNPDLVIARIQEAGALFRLSAADVISLRERGLPLVVIEHILSAERQRPTESAGKILPPTQNTRPPAANNRPWPLMPALYQGL